MRFRATVSNVKTFTRVVQSVEKVSRRCVFRLAADKIQVICTGDSEGVQVWSQVNVDALFEDFRIESNAENRIAFEVSTDSLHRALRSAANAEVVIVRLAKKGDHPFLSFQILTSGTKQKHVEITQDVVIRILKPAEFDSIQEPLCPEPDVHIVMPELSKLRITAERMRHMGSVVSLSANHDGKMRLSMRTDTVEAETEWGRLKHPILGPSQSEPENPKAFYSVLLDVRSLHKFLSSYVIATTTIACICAGHCAIFYVYIGDVQHSGGVLTFYVPALAEGDPDSS